MVKPKQPFAASTADIIKSKVSFHYFRVPHTDSVGRSQLEGALWAKRGCVQSRRMRRNRRFLWLHIYFRLLEMRSSLIYCKRMYTLMLIIIISFGRFAIEVRDFFLLEIYFFYCCSGSLLLRINFNCEPPAVSRASCAISKMRNYWSSSMHRWSDSVVRVYVNRRILFSGRTKMSLDTQIITFPTTAPGFRFAKRQYFSAIYCVRRRPTKYAKQK